MKHIETAVSQRLEIAASGEKDAKALLKALNVKLNKAWASAEHKANMAGKKLKDPTVDIVKAFASSNKDKVKMVVKKGTVSIDMGQGTKTFNMIPQLQVIGTNFVLVSMRGRATLKTDETAVAKRLEVASNKDKWDLSGLEEEVKSMSKSEQAKHLSDLISKMKERMSVLKGNIQTHGSDRAREDLTNEFGSLYFKIPILEGYEQSLKSKGQIKFRK